MNANPNLKFKVIGATNQVPYIDIDEVAAYIGATSGDVTVAAADITDSTSIGVSLITAQTQAAARTAIGAGTSNLAIGTTASTAAAGNHTHTASVVTKTAMFEGDTTTNVQQALELLAQRIAALENPTT